MLTPRRYDVITADVIHPIFAGSGNLYSVEYFRQMRRVLNPGGLVLQWVAGTEAEYKTIARTFLERVSGTTAWVRRRPARRLGRAAAPAPQRLRGKLKLPAAGRACASWIVEASTRCSRRSPRAREELAAFVATGVCSRTTGR